ncbi:PRC-barrel domain-containing protein [Rhodopila sp.]|uniref:PRC-barrel domain-containing protein n=1 Tax=Rhodopila sp. TaxID=2480087 RepID=UPI003D0F817A
MIRPARLSLVALLGALGSARAQAPPQPPNAQPPTAPAATAAANLPGTPKSADLVVATVKLQGGLRASRLIGSAVYNDQNEKVGSVDDLIVKEGDRIVMAVVSVGGFLGIGNKLVAVPYQQLHIENSQAGTKVTMPGASKDALNAMPTFTYSG